MQNDHILRICWSWRCSDGPSFFSKYKASCTKLKRLLHTSHLLPPLFLHHWYSVQQQGVCWGVGGVSALCVFSLSLCMCVWAWDERVVPWPTGFRPRQSLLSGPRSHPHQWLETRVLDQSQRAAFWSAAYTGAHVSNNSRTEILD